jgi:hypothetical protein
MLQKSPLTYKCPGITWQWGYRSRASLRSAMMDRMSECRGAQDLRNGRPFRRIAPAPPCAPRCTYVPVGKKKRGLGNRAESTSLGEVEEH